MRRRAAQSAAQDTRRAIATWIFYTRGRLARIEARAQQAQRQATEAQLKLLEARREPHMLFDTPAGMGCRPSSRGWPTTSR